MPAYLDSLLQKAKEGKPPVVEEGKKVLVDSYGDVRIYKEPGESMLLYDVPSPHYRGEEKALIDALIEIALNVVIVDGSQLTIEERKKTYVARVLEIIEKTPELKVPNTLKEFYARAVAREMVGYGLLDPLTSDDQLEEIMVIGPNKPVYVFHRKYEMLKTNVVFYEDKDIRDLVDRIARAIGRRIDLQVPLLDARLKDGSRVNATLPPISLDGTTITLRKFRKDPLTVIDLIKYGTVDFKVASFLWLASDGAGAYPANILIAGGTASGKTTSLNMLTSFVPNTERVVSIEDIAELNLPLPHWIRMEVRPASIEGTGEINMNDLVKNSVRMRPDRIIVGEVRGEEGYTLFAAMNTGHRGCFGTVHANSARETLVRLTSPPISVPEIMISSLNLILMQNRIHDRRKGTLRRITEVAEVLPGSSMDKPELQVLYDWDPVKDELRETGNASYYLQLLSKYTGLTQSELGKEMQAREDLLREMVKKGTRDIFDVCSITQGFVPKRKLLI